MKIIHPLRIDLLDFFIRGEFNSYIRDIIYQYEINEIVDNMLTEDDVIYSMFKERMLTMFVENGVKLAVANIFPINNFAVELYSFYTINVTPYQFAKYGKIYVDKIKQLPVIRMQATVLKNNLAAMRWHEKLGFKMEGLLKKYDGKNDYYLYSYINYNEDKP